MQEKNEKSDFFDKINLYLDEIIYKDKFKIALSNPIFTNQYYSFIKENIENFQDFIPIKDNFKLDNVLYSMIAEEEEMNNLKNMRFVIFENAQKQKIIGDIILYDIENHNFNSCFIGYKIDKNFEGLGIITFFMDKVLEIGLNTMGIHRIIAEILPENKRSIKIILKFKFLCEGISRKNLQIANKWRDHLRFSLIRNS